MVFHLPRVSSTLWESYRPTMWLHRMVAVPPGWYGVEKVCMLLDVTCFEWEKTFFRWLWHCYSMLNFDHSRFVSDRQMTSASDEFIWSMDRWKSKQPLWWDIPFGFWRMMRMASLGLWSGESPKMVLYDSVAGDRVVGRRWECVLDWVEWLWMLGICDGISWWWVVISVDGRGVDWWWWFGKYHRRPRWWAIL